MTSVTDLKNISTSPSIPVSCSIKLDCSEDNLQENITAVAECVSKIYARFPRLNEEERDQLREKNVEYGKITYELPSVDQCKKFQVALQSKIVYELSKNSEHNNSITLSVDNTPVHVLYVIAKRTFPDMGFFDSYFPRKAYTYIELNQQKTNLSLEMNFEDRHWLNIVARR
ncbi:MAG: hypothetical protein H7A37_06290 [Chlamydiales bacterium]|nr:hypothetical protein [Chlamydiales bacterium]